MIFTSKASSVWLAKSVWSQVSERADRLAFLAVLSGILWHFEG